MGKLLALFAVLGMAGIALADIAPGPMLPGSRLAELVGPLLIVVGLVATIFAVDTLIVLWIVRMMRYRDAGSALIGNGGIALGVLGLLLIVLPFAVPQMQGMFATAGMAALLFFGMGALIFIAFADLSVLLLLKRVKFVDKRAELAGKSALGILGAGALAFLVVAAMIALMVA